MKTLRKHGYLNKTGILLIAIALVVAMVGYGGNCEGADETFDLTMAVNPGGAGTAIDLTGTSPYTVLTVVNISAVAAPCYRFVGWTAPLGLLADANAAQTTFAMPASDVTVTANFEEVPPDHYKFYEVDWETAPDIGKEVQLVDQFGTFNAIVGEAVSFGNPVEKVHADIPTPIADLTRHYTLYELLYEEDHQAWQVTVNNQFQDDVELTVFGPEYLAVPTQKEDHGMPVCLNHYLVYEAYGPAVDAEVMLSDQFVSGEGAVVWEPYYFANPVEKTVLGAAAPTPIEDPDLHWVLYDIWDEGSPPIEARIQIDNQFGPQTLDLLEREYLAVPSQKISWEQPLNHFKTYWADWGEEPPMYGVDVQLEDQFVTINATVYEPFLFANPVSKLTEEEEWTPIWDPRNHLAFYDIGYAEDPQMWEVTVNNQFGNDQWLQVVGPLWLAVPTQKVDHGPPEDLNHFLVYVVIDWTSVPEPEQVLLTDQFNWPEGEIVWRLEPEFFAVPAQKTHGPATTPIKDDKHLVLYGIGGGEFIAYDLPVINQFGEQFLDVWQGEEDYLGVPSDKIEVSGPFPAPI